MCRYAAPSHLQQMGLIPFLHTSIPTSIPARAMRRRCKRKSVTHAVSTMCNPCGEHAGGPALPVCSEA